MAAPVSVSVVVPVFNAAGTLPALLSALRAQLSHPLGATEYLFVDNGSSDESRPILDGAAPEGSLVLEETRRGVSAARNRGVAAANGEVLAMIDADCVPVRQWLRELVTPFADPAVMLAAGGLASYPPRTGAQRFAARYGLNDAERNLAMAGIRFANGRNMAVRHDAAQAIGGWPADMDRAEDIEFSYRLRKRFGCEIVYRPLALAFHQDRATDEELRQQAFGYGRGMAMLYRRHPDVLPWGAAQRARRARMTLRRRLGATRHRLAGRLRRSGVEDVEFSAYLALWDASFWRGFDAERRAPDATT